MYENFPHKQKNWDKIIICKYNNLIVNIIFFISVFQEFIATYKPGVAIGFLVSIEFNHDMILIIL